MKLTLNVNFSSHLEEYLQYLTFASGIVYKILGNAPLIMILSREYSNARRYEKTIDLE
jgi:hypothetical protein